MRNVRVHLTDQLDGFWTMIAHMLRLLAISTAAIAAVSVAAISQTTQPQPAPTPPQSAPSPQSTARANAMAACRADVRALCATVERGKGAKMDCLVANKAKASPECQAAMATMQEQMAARRAEGGKRGRLADCRADAASLCPEAKGRDRVQCLRQNKAKVSPACSQALAAMPMGKRDAAPAAAPPSPPPAAPSASDAPKPQ
jgi:hypothetical protein